MWFKDWINEKEKRPKKLGDLVKKEKRKRRIKDKLSWEGSSNAMPPYHESPRQPLRVNTQHIEMLLFFFFLLEMRIITDEYI